MSEGEKPDARSVRFAGPRMSATAARVLGSVPWGPTSNAECAPERAPGATSCPPTLVPNAKISFAFRPYLGALTRNYLIAQPSATISMNSMSPDAP